MVLACLPDALLGAVNLKESAYMVYAGRQPCMNAYCKGPSNAHDDKASNSKSIQIISDGQTAVIACCKNQALLTMTMMTSPAVHTNDCDTLINMSFILQSALQGHSHALHA